jgi:hypothetical protein
LLDARKKKGGGKERGLQAKGLKSKNICYEARQRGAWAIEIGDAEAL